MNIKEQLNTENENNKKLIIQYVTDELKKNKVSNNLISYILRYVHQNGISQAGTNFFQGELFLDLSFSFLFGDKHVRIEVISPTQVRIVSPVAYNSYAVMNADGLPEPPTQNEKNIRYEFTNILLEDLHPDDTPTTLYNIKVTTEDCFYEITDQNVANKLQTALLRKAILDIIDKVELESFDRSLLTPYVLSSQKLNFHVLPDASPGILLMLMLTDYSYAIEIMDNDTYRNKILNSEFNIYLYDVYERHKDKYQFMKDHLNMSLWTPIKEGIELFDNILEISKEIQSLSTKDNAETKIAIAEKQALQKSIAISSLNKQSIYDALRTYNVEDKIKLLSFPEIANTLTASQLVELLKSNIKLATILLDPQAISSTVFDSHPIHKLTDKNLLEIIQSHPELWRSNAALFGIKTSKVQGIPYRYKLSADSLIECVFSDDETLRSISIEAIANDPKLISTLFSSERLTEVIDNNEQIKLLQNLLRLYLESPDNVRSHIKELTIYTSDISKILASNNPNDNEIAKPFSLSLLQNQSIDELLNGLVNLFDHNLATPETLNLYTQVIKFHLTEDNASDKMWIALQNNSKSLFLFMQHIISHDDKESYQIIFNLLNLELAKESLSNSPNVALQDALTLLLENMFSEFCIDNFIKKIPDIELFKLYKSLTALYTKLDEDQRLSHTESARELLRILNTIITNPGIEAVMVLKINQLITLNQITNYQANELANLYLSNASFGKTMESHPFLTKKVIENSDLSLLIDMLKMNIKLSANIIQSFSTNAEFRNKIINGQLKNANELLSIIFNFAKTNELESLIQLIYVCKPHNNINFISLIKNNPLLLAKEEAYFNTLFDIKSMSMAKQFIALPSENQKEWLSDESRVVSLLDNANSKELDIIFSSHYELLTSWRDKISSPSNIVSPHVRESVIKLSRPQEIATIYLATDKFNKSIILNNQQILECMLSDQSNIARLYNRDEAIRNIVNNNTIYANFMLFNNNPGPVLFDIYMNGSVGIRNEIITNNVLLDKMILMTSQNNLLHILQAQPELSSKIINRIYEHYQATEYMKWIVNAQPKLLNEIILALNATQVTSLLLNNSDQFVLSSVIYNNKLNQLNIDQLIVLLNTKNPLLVKAITHNSACCNVVLNADKIKIQTILDHQKIVKEMKKTLPFFETQDEITEAMEKLQTKVTGKEPSALIKKNGPPSSIGIKSSH